MSPTPRRIASLATSLALSALPALAQQGTGRERFVPGPTAFHFAIDDLPALLAGTAGTPLGKLFAEPDVAAALAAMLAERDRRVAAELAIGDELIALEPHALGRTELIARALDVAGWRSLKSLARLAQIDPNDGERWRTHDVLLIEPADGHEAALVTAFDAAFKDLQARVGGDAKGEQTIDGHAAVVLPDNADAAEFSAQRNGTWYLHLPGQLALGTGKPAERGACSAVTAPAPGVTIAAAVQTFLGFSEPNDEVSAAMQAMGLDHCTQIGWALHQTGALVQTEVTAALDGKPGGILGALLDGMAPSVDQPLPANGLLQVRCAFDVGALLAAIDQLLALNQGPTLRQLGLDEDLRKAWTGGVALGLTAPAPGGLVPRMFLSLGVADEPALGRVLDRLCQMAGVATKPITLESVPCTQLDLPDAPPAIKVCYTVRDGVLHVAESGLSLRALLKAGKDGAPRALDVGDAPRPTGKGAMVPSFDLRFDAGAIYRALDEIWIPLLEKAAGMDDEWRPLVKRDQMPDADTVVPHLGKGRGVLRRDAKQLAIAMSGTLGGPEVTALMASFPTALSGQFARNAAWQQREMITRIATAKINTIYTAIHAFEQRTGKRPRTLGELVPSGDLKDVRWLSMPGDGPSEPVLQDGKEIGRSSFRYFPDGVKVTPDDTEVTAILISLAPGYQRRLVIDEHGSLHTPWNELANQAIDEIGK